MKNIEKCLEYLNRTGDIYRSLSELRDIKPYITSDSTWDNFFDISTSLRIFEYFSMSNQISYYNPYVSCYDSIKEKKEFVRIKPIINNMNIPLSLKLNILLNYFESYVKQNKQLEFEF